jgi:transposase
MYFHRKHSKTGRCLQLLESYRPAGAGGPRHRVVASLGDADIPEGWLGPLSVLVSSRLAGKPLLLAPELPPEGLAWVDRIVQAVERRRGDEAAAMADGRTLDGVLADGAEHSHSTVLGPLLVGLHAWRRLNLDGLLCRLGFNPAQRQAACALILGRLAEPMSENAFHGWLPQSSLPDLLGQEVCGGGVQRYYRIGDKLLESRAEIEAGLRDGLARHFGLHRTIFLYDLTNFHFEGTGGENPLAVRGKNKQMRDDCPQVVVGVVFDEFGFEIMHRTFAGNTSDSRTLPAMAQCLHQASIADRLPMRDVPTVVVDGGLATKDNLAELRRLGFHYLVNDKRTRRSTWLELFRQGGFTPVAGRQEDEQVMVRHIDLGPGEFKLEVDERIVLCKSAGRRHKELAIRSNAEERFLRDLALLAKRLGQGRPKTVGGAERALGKVLAKHPRVARFYETGVSSGTNLSLSWRRDDARWDAEDELAGCYALRTDRRDLEGEELWRLYMTLCRAEDGFQTVKSDLGLRPAFHRIEERVDAHVFITVLAYQVLRFILHTLELQGDFRSWYTLRHVLATHCYATIHLPLKDGTVHRLRKPGRPEACQWDIYKKIGIENLRHLPATTTVAHA